MRALQKQILYAIAVVALAVTPLAWRTVRLRYKVYAATNVSPFTIHQHYEVTGSHVGIASLMETRVIAVRGDGSRVDLKRESRRNWDYRVINFANGLVQTVFDESHVVSTFQRDSVEQTKFQMAKPDPAANCISDLGGKPSIHPSSLQGMESRFNTPVFRIVNASGIVTWQAPSLACTALEHFMEWDPAHPGTNTSALKVDAITLGEPDQKLFSVPADYTEMPLIPATVMHLRAGATPEDFIQKQITSPALIRNDEYYMSHRPAK